MFQCPHYSKVMFTWPASTEGGNSTVRLAVVLEDPALLITTIQNYSWKIRRLFFACCSQCSWTPRHPPGQGGWYWGNPWYIVTFLHFLRKVNKYLLFLFKMDILDIFLLKYDEGNLLIIIIPGGSFLFITLVSQGTEIPVVCEYLSSHDSVTI